MSGLFASRGSSSEPWFRLGRLEVSTVMFVVLAVVASWLAWVAVPNLPARLFYTPSAVAAGEVWRLVTWPFANELGLWGVLYLFFFWYFGTELERQIGRMPMLWLLVGIWASITVAATVVALGLGGGLSIAGIGLVQFALLLIWIAEYPNRPFFFGIPAWVVGVVLVGVQALVMLAARDGESLLSLLLSLVMVAVVARRIGLLTDYAWIPGGRRPRPSGGRTPRVSGRPSRGERRMMSDKERLDALLDRINEQGIQSLTDAQRRELMRLRDRLRRS